jgi:hypothetical protein
LSRQSLIKSNGFGARHRCDPLKRTHALLGMRLRVCGLGHQTRLQTFAFEGPRRIAQTFRRPRRARSAVRTKTNFGKGRHFRVQRRFSAQKSSRFREWTLSDVIKLLCDPSRSGDTCSNAGAGQVIMNIRSATSGTLHSVPPHLSPNIKLAQRGPAIGRSRSYDAAARPAVVPLGWSTSPGHELCSFPRRRGIAPFKLPALNAAPGRLCTGGRGLGLTRAEPPRREATDPEPWPTA